MARAPVRQRSDWHHILSGMRAYGVALTLVWAVAATSLLVVFAIVVSGAWLHAVLGGAAAAELLFSALTLILVRRASVSGRFDT